MFVASSALVAAASSLVAPVPEPPFAARLLVDSAYVRAAPRADAPEVGLLHRDDEVTVIGCVPSCDAPGAWALVAGDGAIRRSLLERVADDDERLPPQLARYRWAAVRARSSVYARPDAASRVVARVKTGHALAFLVDDELFARGWLPRAAGGFVRVERVRFARPSAFAGEERPSLPLAFAWRPVHLPDGSVAPRHARLRVTVPGARDVVTARRPARVRPDEKWVHVSLRRQVLTAYEGDQLVYATLVSTGKRDTPTPRGLYRVWVKTAHEPMHGRAGDPYFVDEVPWAMFFRDGLSLHGTYWHDRFGTPVSHGCVNLSLADARWLFDWAPPSLPIGWHSVIPLAAGRPSLWVLVTR